MRQESWLVESSLRLNSFASRVVEYWDFLPYDIFNVNKCGRFQRKAELYKFSEIYQRSSFSVTIIACPALFASMNFVHMMKNLNCCK